MISLDEYDEIWMEYLTAATDIQCSIEGRLLTQYLLDSTRERFYALYKNFQAREPLLPYIDAWINPREAIFCLIVRPNI